MEFLQPRIVVTGRRWDMRESLFRKDYLGLYEFTVG
jgi:hypothetical protein